MQGTHAVAMYWEVNSKNMISGLTGTRHRPKINWEIQEGSGWSSICDMERPHGSVWDETLCQGDQCYCRDACRTYFQGRPLWHLPYMVKLRPCREIFFARFASLISCINSMQVGVAKSLPSPTVQCSPLLIVLCCPLVFVGTKKYKHASGKTLQKRNWPFTPAWNRYGWHACHLCIW